MKEIIVQNPNKDNSEGAPINGAQVKARAVRRSSALGSINKLRLDIALDELDEDSPTRREDLRELLRSRYADEKKKFEASHPDVVKNGTYIRKFVFLDPIDEGKVFVLIVMQKYKNRKNNHTETFYGGGLFMPRLPYLICQALTILAEKEAYCNLCEQGPADEQSPSLQEYCRSWGITVKLYYSFFNRIMGMFTSAFGKCTREEFKSLLFSYCYN